MLSFFLEGRIQVSKESKTIEEVQKLFPQLEAGGTYRPNDCRARDRVAIIVPFRDRQEHLSIFLFNMHHLLIRQQIDYSIFVVEQLGKIP